MTFTVRLATCQTLHLISACRRRLAGWALGRCTEEFLKIFTKSQKPSNANLCLSHLLSLSPAVRGGTEKVNHPWRKVRVHFTSVKAAESVECEGRWRRSGPVISVGCEAFTLSSADWGVPWVTLNVKPSLVFVYHNVSSCVSGPVVDACRRCLRLCGFLSGTVPWI